ncbi:chorismate-binding protein [Deinococcus humi]|uniref:Anthranilate synthase n=1 Tax=Deinococcus humi TaxID=662880 RepID=A0A7W8JT56_9DEIO|nr:chorismate-binding protein [Deinococcus humi]MBB5362659.1 anthranilate synthase [Deinococcus humi]GGO31216.1 aminodeoxychorismate components I/II [Deinococcus humi]
MTLSPTLSPADVLLRLRAAHAPGVVLLESLGPAVPYGRYSFLSAWPTVVQDALPERPAGRTHFPAWLGGLKYEAARDFGLVTHAARGEAAWWGHYPSGLVWDRQAGTLEVVGLPHVNWKNVLALDPAPPPTLNVGAFGADDVNYPAGVRAIQELIRAGEVYQVNLSRGVRAHAEGDPLAAYLRLRELNPSPFMAFLDMGAEVVVSCSPERLVEWAGGTVSARPIAGTRRRGQTEAEDRALEAELRASPKEVAEHLMLVDLVRHDLGRVSAAGSVHVPELMLVERYSHVMHLVSEVRGEAAGGTRLREVLAATFPGGTITGAPKERVMTAIRDHEPGPRGWYTGGVGILSGARVNLNILIRTAAFTRLEDSWEVEVRAGGGTVIDSNPAHEARETVHKAQALLSALAGVPGRPAQPPASPTPGGMWTPPPAQTAGAGVRVHLLDNRDSFTWNLVHDLRALGAAVTVYAQDVEVSEVLRADPHAVLIGPGPGTPDTSGPTLALTRECLRRGLPLLGVCLGHQALGQVLGGTVDRAAPVHGRPEAVQHSGTGLFEGLPPGASFGRYHSLVVRGLAPEYVTARGAGGEIMALAVPAQPAWGVQFHPESVLSPAGRILLGNWLRLSREWNERAAGRVQEV